MRFGSRQDGEDDLEPEPGDPAYDRELAGQLGITAAHLTTADSALGEVAVAFQKMADEDLLADPVFAEDWPGDDFQHDLDTARRCCRNLRRILNERAAQLEQD